MVFSYAWQRRCTNEVRVDRIPLDRIFFVTALDAPDLTRPAHVFRTIMNMEMFTNVANTAPPSEIGWWSHVSVAAFAWYEQDLAIPRTPGDPFGDPRILVWTKLLPSIQAVADDAGAYNVLWTADPNSVQSQTKRKPYLTGSTTASVCAALYINDESGFINNGGFSTATWCRVGLEALFGYPSG